MENVVENVVEAAAPVAVEVAPVVEKTDRRKGARKSQLADGTVSYGFKADGTPRKKPGRPAKPAAVNVA